MSRDFRADRARTRQREMNDRFPLRLRNAGCARVKPRQIRALARGGGNRPVWESRLINDLGNDNSGDNGEERSNPPQLTRPTTSSAC